MGGEKGKICFDLCTEIICSNPSKQGTLFYVFCFINERNNSLKPLG
jgi:hypothetical protein